ncbi:hypothetical protein HX866_04100 [Pseudomonas gingeri]|uniref:hypothetical protein n=1 Tax=Pseudomonas gingeri TaxID=117681 RepID=UPI00159FCB96|nr:hypothetical protein [Pseudomonas gingeri]NWA24065.1 hypothetical protein [Pseudomonas gingeri]
MSSFEGALIKEQGITFAIVLVKHHVTGSSHESGKVRESFQPHFPGTPVVLASQDSRGTFRYQGRTDLVDFLASVDASRIPWKKFSY